MTTSGGEAPLREYRIAAVDRALDVVEALARIGPAPLARVAEEARCTRSAAFRLLRTLQARDFAVQEPHGPWRLGLRWALASPGETDPGALAAAAAGHLARLSAKVGENVLLRVRTAGASATVAFHQARPELAMRYEADRDGPLHAGSGRMLLAYAPADVQAAALRARLRRYTAATRTDPSWVAGDLPRIRQRGWMIATNEVAEGSVVVAAPVRDARGEVAAALVVAAAALRVRPAEARALVPVLLDAAAGLSRALGAG